MKSIRLTRKDFDRLALWMGEYDTVGAVDIEEEPGGGIGTFLYVSIEEEENGFTVKKRYEISSVEDW